MQEQVYTASQLITVGTYAAIAFGLLAIFAPAAKDKVVGWLKGKAADVAGHVERAYLSPSGVPHGVEEYVKLIRSECVGADSDFILELVSSGTPVELAKKRHIERQHDELAKLRKGA